MLPNFIIPHGSKHFNILGEWWNAEVEDVIAEALKIGGPYNISDALTINGQPGVLYNCSLDGKRLHIFLRKEGLIVPIDSGTTISYI